MAATIFVNIIYWAALILKVVIEYLVMELGGNASDGADLNNKRHFEAGEELQIFDKSNVKYRAMEFNAIIIGICSPKLVKMYGNVLDDPSFDYHTYFKQSIKLQIIDGHIVMFHVDNKAKAIVNCDLTSSKSGKIMYGIFDVKHGYGVTVFELSRFLSGKMIHKMAKKWQIKSYHLPKSSRQSAEFQQQLVQPHIDALREGVALYERYCVLDCLPCIATVVIDEDSHYIEWVQIVYDKLCGDYSGIGFKYIQSALLVIGYHKKEGRDLHIPTEILNIITLYCPKVMISATGLHLDNIRSKNKLLGPNSSLTASNAEFDNIRILGDRALCLNEDGSSGFAFPPYN